LPFVQSDALLQLPGHRLAVRFQRARPRGPGMDRPARASDWRGGSQTCQRLVKRSAEAVLSVGDDGGSVGLSRVATLPTTSTFRCRLTTACRLVGFDGTAPCDPGIGGGRLASAHRRPLSPARDNPAHKATTGDSPGRFLPGRSDRADHVRSWHTPVLGELIHSRSPHPADACNSHSGQAGKAAVKRKPGCMMEGGDGVGLNIVRAGICEIG